MKELHIKEYPLKNEGAGGADMRSTFLLREKRRFLSGTGEAGRSSPYPGTEDHDLFTGFQHIPPDGRGHNEGFAVVDDGGREGTVRTLNPGLPAFHKVEDIDGIVDVDDPAAKDRMALGLNKLQAVQSGMLDRAGRIPGCHFFLMQKVFFTKGGIAVGLNIGDPVVNMDGPGQAVQPDAAPVPQLKGKDIGRCADFQDDRIFARAVDGAGGDQHMIVLFDREAVDEPLGIERADA